MKSNQELFFNACKEGNLKEVKYLSTLKGVDASAGDNYAIRGATERGHLEIVKYLLTIPKVRKSYI